MSQKVFFFPIPNALTLPNIGLPFHIFEPRYRQMIRDAIRDQVPVAVTTPSVDYRGRIFSAGVPEVLQEYPDGRLDVVVRGELKGKVDEFIDENPYKIFKFHELHENLQLSSEGKFKRECLVTALRGWAVKQVLDKSQLQLFNQVIEDDRSLVSYASLFLLDSPATRQRVLEQQCLEKKMEMILHEWAPEEISLGVFLPPLKF